MLANLKSNMSEILFDQNPSHLTKRREWVFLLIAGLFLGTLATINLIGLSRFVDLSFTLGNVSIPFLLPLGVLPYPITFLCTDIVSEFYGKTRANQLVWIGLAINLWMIALLWVGSALPPNVPLTDHLPDANHPDYAFYKIRLLTMGNVMGSLLAYLVAQLLDVHLFHFWKNFTKGKHLWLRNNGSTLISQFIDTLIVTTVAFLITDALPTLPGKTPLGSLWHFIIASYSFKAIIALCDTIPFYMIVYALKRYFQIAESTAAVGENA